MQVVNTLKNTLLLYETLGYGYFAGKALGKWQYGHSKGAWGNVTVIWGNLLASAEDFSREWSS